MVAEVWLRIGLVASVLVMAVLVAGIARRGAVIARRPGVAGNLPVGLTLFSSVTCNSCSVVRSRLERSGAEFFEVVYEDRADLFETHGVSDVPTLVGVAVDGRAWMASGVPSENQIKRWSVLDRPMEIS